MSSYNKAKGSKFETDVMKYLRKLGHFAERLAKAGANDEGDIVTIILPECEANSCCQLVVKAEMGPPLGNRKITLLPSANTSTIDGDTEYVMNIPWESVQLFCRDGNWFII